ncbi:MAG: chaperonin 10-like protein [Benniella sp.]|nr:MAG: chaperonin 10-like protein [Benniella sp.]
MTDSSTSFNGWSTGGDSKLHKTTFSPRVLGPKDVEIRIHNCGICDSDIHMMDEDWCKLHGEVVPGHEIAGVVVAAGPEALCNVGDRVGATVLANTCLECDECMSGREQLCPKKTYVYKDTFKDECPAPSYGGFADRIRLNSEFVYKIPDSIPLDEAAPLFCPGVTAYAALRRAGAGPTTTVGIKGIGNLGHLAIQFARAFSSKEIIAIADSPTNAEDPTTLGADRLVDFSNPEHVKAETHKFDILLVNSFDKSTSWENIVKMTANRGAIVVLALCNEPIQLPTMELVHREIKVAGSFQGSRKDVKDMLAFVEQHKIHPWIVKVPFDQINDGIALMKKATARYSIVLEAGGQDPSLAKKKDPVEESLAAAAKAQIREIPTSLE